MKTFSTDHLEQRYQFVSGMCHIWYIYKAQLSCLINLTWRSSYHKKTAVCCFLSQSSKFSKSESINKLLAVKSLEYCDTLCIFSPLVPLVKLHYICYKLTPSLTKLDLETTTLYTNSFRLELKLWFSQSNLPEESAGAAEFFRVGEEKGGFLGFYHKTINIY